MQKCFELKNTVLALDPSLNCTGYSIFFNGELKCYGTIHFSSYIRKGQYKKTIGEKLHLIEKRIKELIDEHNVELVVMEKYIMIFSGPSMKLNTSAETAKLLPMVRGIIRKSLFEKKVPYTEVWDGEVKKILTGNGRAKKEEIREVVNKMYYLKLNTQKDLNISDSIGVGVVFFEIYSMSINKKLTIDDSIDFLEKYHGLKTKTQKALRLIGADINKWKSLMK